MTDAQVIGLAIFGPIGIAVLWAWITQPRKPKYDERVPRNHRRVTHNGFKSRIGAR